MTEETEAALSPEEKQVLQEALGYGGALPEGKHNVHTFLHNVAIAEDTTKLGYLKEEEIGPASNPTRAYKHMALFADKVMEDDVLKDFFTKSAEIVSSTSLSRDGFLAKLAVVQRRELADLTKGEAKKNKGWFSKKDKTAEGGLT